MFAYQQDVRITVPDSPWLLCYHPSLKVQHKLDAVITSPAGVYGLSSGEGWGKHITTTMNKTRKNRPILQQGRLSLGRKKGLLMGR